MLRRSRSRQLSLSVVGSVADSAAMDGVRRTQRLASRLRLTARGGLSHPRDVPPCACRHVGSRHAHSQRLNPPSPHTQASSVAVSGNFAYVAAFNSDSLAVVDVSSYAPTPTNAPTNAPGPIATIRGDPHVRGAHRDSFE